MVPVVSIVGPSGSGKTTLIEKIIRKLTDSGVSVTAVKCAHHGFDMDRPGKDSARLKSAGACSVGLISPNGWAVMADEADIAFSDLLTKFPPTDLVITEGGSQLDTPKVEILPPPLTEPSKALPQHLIALVGENLRHENLPCFDRDSVSEIADFIIGRFF